MKIGIKDIVLRYSLIMLLGFFISIFYFIFKPLTVYSVYFILKLFYTVTLSNNTLIVNNTEIEIINACIAGSAYYLLFLLNFSTRNIKFKKRIFVFFIDSAALFLINILRIIILSVLLIKESFLFESIHLIFWYLLSILIVFLIWIFTAKILKIKSVPIISDFLVIKKMITSKVKR